MTFRVDPAALNAYRMKLQEVYSDVAMAENYVNVHGDFSFHESGIIGKLAGRHADLMQQLIGLHDQLEVILVRSMESLGQASEDYDATDTDAAARVDATYPEAPRPTPRRD